VSEAVADPTVDRARALAAPIATIEVAIFLLTLISSKRECATAGDVCWGHVMQ
jgi:hypothetical protein